MLKTSILARSVSLTLAFLAVCAAGCEASQAGVLAGTATSDTIASAEGFVVGVAWQEPAADCADLAGDDVACMALPYTTSGGAPLEEGSITVNAKPSGYLHGDFPATFKRSLEVPPLNASYSTAAGSGGADEQDGDGRGEFSFGFIVATNAADIDVTADLRDANADAPIGVADIRVVFARDVNDEALAAWGGLHNGMNLVRMEDGAFEVLADDADIELTIATVGAVRDSFRYSDSALLRASDDVRGPAL